MQGGGELLPYFGLGQSLLALVPRLRPLGERPGPVDRQRAWVFPDTGDPRPVKDPAQDLPASVLAGVHPHLRHGRSGPLTAASAQILRALRPEDRLLTVNLARRSTALAAFLPGSPIFRTVETCLRRSAEVAGEHGLSLNRLVVSWVHGQADARTPHRVYLEQLGQLTDGLAEALADVTGGRGQLLFCLSQTTATYPPGRRGVPLAQLDFAVARPGQVIIAGPEYMFERSDGVHLKPRSAVRLGAMHGRAIRQALSGAGWEPLRMVDAEVTGTNVRVTFAGGLGPIEAADAAAPVDLGVRSLEHMGFLWLQRGSTCRIVAARISGAREVSLVLSERPDQLDRARLSLGFPEGIGRLEGFVSGDPSTARGGATGLRTAGGDSGPFGESQQDWALQQLIALRWSESA